MSVAVPLPLYVSYTSLEERQQQCARILAKHGENMLPIVLQAVGKNAKVNFTALPPTATVADLQLVVREVGDVSKKSAAALQIAGCSPTASVVLADLYAAFHSEDGFLYVCYLSESRLGGPGCLGTESGGVSVGVSVEEKKRRSRSTRTGEPHAHRHHSRSAMGSVHTAPTQPPPQQQQQREVAAGAANVTSDAARQQYYHELNRNGVYPAAPVAAPLYPAANGDSEEKKKEVYYYYQPNADALYGGGGAKQ